MMQEEASGGTGSSLAKVVIVVAGFASLFASFISIVSIWLQSKNYRKPLLQRYVIRILLMVPIFSVSSWTSVVSLKAAAFISPIRDIYEAFTIYTFFQLLINFLGGERALIIMTHGRPPVQHTWPLNQFLPKVDISDPYTFLKIKRGILQYAWLKPILALAAIILKATGTYQEGYIGLSSGYLWTGIVYNLSVTISLYSLALFWVCMNDDLKPFRPIPKFLSVKLIIFASYWQGFFLSILQWLGALPNGPAGYTPNNMAAAIQDILICCEMPIFAIVHWYAFSWQDYADPSISAARMPVKYAFRDAFGIKDLIEDTKETFRGEKYQYRFFDSGDNVMAHEESDSRLARVMDGMRYERGGKSKYWIPKPREANSRTPLLDDSASSSRRGSQHRTHQRSSELPEEYDIEDLTLDEEDETWFTNARALEFGDWNYPVITANEVHRESSLQWRRQSSGPSNDGYSGEGSRVKRSNKRRTTNRQVANEPRRNQTVDGQSRRSSTHSQPGKSNNTRSSRSQLVDLVDDVESAERERAEAQSDHSNKDIAEARLMSRNKSQSSSQNENTESQPTTDVQQEWQQPGASTPSPSESPKNVDYNVFDDEHDAWNTSRTTH